MMAAQKGGPLGALLDAYVRRKVQGAFRAVWVRGELPGGEAPLLVYAHHSNFWDGLLAHQLCEAAGRDGYALMEEGNLRRYRFLARLGAFSIRKGDPASALESLRYARALLGRPRAALFVFPEGEHRPFGKLPLRLERGVELLARTAAVRCVPVAFRCAFFEGERPEALVEVGEAHAPGPLALFQQNLEAVVQRVAAAEGPAGFRPLLAGARGVQEWWDDVRGLPRGEGGVP